MTGTWSTAAEALPAPGFTGAVIIPVAAAGVAARDGELHVAGPTFRVG